jgi:hypothetical protein
MKTNPFDTIVSDLVSEMHSVDQQFAGMAGNVPPFDSQKPTPEEDALIFDHPAARYPGAMDPQTGMPISNAQAAQRMLQEMGPTKYIAWVEGHAKRLGLTGDDDEQSAVSDQQSAGDEDATG